MSKISEALQKAIQEREKLKEGIPKDSTTTHIIEIGDEINGELKRNLVFLNADADPAIQEGFRVIRTNLSANGRCKSILITSPTSKDGKSFISLNLAGAMAMAGEKVLLVDTHIGNPRLEGVFGYEHTPGLMEIISVGSKWQDVIHKTPITNLYFIATGYPFKNHTELFGSPRMDNLIKEWENEFDRLILDSCPISGDTDSLILARKVKGVIIVTRMGKTNKEHIKYTKDALKKVNANILGFILTEVKSYIPKVIERLLGGK